MDTATDNRYIVRFFPLICVLCNDTNKSVLLSVVKTSVDSITSAAVHFTACRLVWSDRPSDAVVPLRGLLKANVRRL